MKVLKTCEDSLSWLLEFALIRVRIPSIPPFALSFVRVASARFLFAII